MSRRSCSPLAELKVLSRALSGFVSDRKRVDLDRAVRFALDEVDLALPVESLPCYIERVVKLYSSHSAAQFAFEHVRIEDAFQSMPLFLDPQIRACADSLYHDQPYGHRILFVTGLSASFLTESAYWTRAREARYTESRGRIESIVCRRDRGQGSTQILVT